MPSVRRSGFSPRCLPVGRVLARDASVRAGLSSGQCLRVFMTHPKDDQNFRRASLAAIVLRGIGTAMVYPELLATISDAADPE